MGQRVALVGQHLERLAVNAVVAGDAAQRGQERRIHGDGTIQGKTYACSMTMMPMIDASATLCQNTNRRIRPSCPCWFVAAVDTTMLWASIIFPITPPVEFAVVIRTGFNPSCSAVIF